MINPIGKFFKKLNPQSHNPVNQIKEHVATREDLDAVEKKLEMDMEESRMNVIKWTAVMLLVQAIIILAVIRIFHNYL